tara:strand:- start:1545 stop:1826 length:282 start_codon:yes stop_codon:yes gene_type:complete
MRISKAKSLISAKPELLALGSYLIKGGVSRGLVADLVAEAADEAIDFKALLPNKPELGAALEAVDYAVFRAAAFLLFPLMKSLADDAKSRIGG